MPFDPPSERRKRRDYETRNQDAIGDKPCRAAGEDELQQRDQQQRRRCEDRVIDHPFPERYFHSISLSL